MFYSFYLHNFRTLRKTRYILLLLLMLLVCVWVFGVLSAHFQKTALSLIFMLFSLMLSLAVMGLRCFFDHQVIALEAWRTKLKT